METPFGGKKSTGLKGASRHFWIDTSGATRIFPNWVFQLITANASFEFKDKTQDTQISRHWHTQDLIWQRRKDEMSQRKNVEVDPERIMPSSI